MAGQTWHGGPRTTYAPEVDLRNVISHQLSHRKEYRQASPEEAVKAVVKP